MMFDNTFSYQLNLSSSKHPGTATDCICVKYFLLDVVFSFATGFYFFLFVFDDFSGFVSEGGEFF